MVNSFILSVLVTIVFISITQSFCCKKKDNNSRRTIEIKVSNPQLINPRSKDVNSIKSEKSSEQLSKEEKK
ncbi:Hypothetical protein SRAE_2000341600 [Strongyloides ratti]|uniref:Uncharacterized protein n=1 Tax=Strongyloides ratti TaxID=34506 RepID=A0A090LG53_STRRB|nr:Hypothetical protein SRAE_2000341600 [Strongyloides ratti]CEF68761.1 Hypothetical protein SRAE_2000341600 [Strongyloides ratti]